MQHYFRTITFLKPILLASVLVLVGCGSSSSDANKPSVLPVVLDNNSYGVIGDNKLQAGLDAIRTAYTVPAIAGFIIKGDSILEMGVSGVRKSNTSVAVTLNDRWSIGSVTKSLTATIAMTLVEQGRISLSSTILDVMPEMAGQIKAEYLSITLKELLSHTSGLVRDLPYLTDLQWFNSKQPLKEQRRLWTNEMLNTDSVVERGVFSYSNGGYVIAGHMLETVTGQSWESLLQTQLLSPFHMTNTSLGVPDINGDLSQPRGHTFIYNAWESKSTEQRPSNPPVMAPASDFVTDLASMAQYLIAHLQGAKGQSNILQASSYKAMHSPVINNQSLGWIELERDFARGKLYYHNGSNGYWYAHMYIIPGEDIALFAVTNASGDGARGASGDVAALASNEVLVAMLTRYGLLP